MLRRLTRTTPVERLTIWTEGDGPVDVGRDAIGIEWTGRLGHPSSYALLGGRLGAGSEVPNEGRRFRGSDARRLDRVFIGLPDEYRSAVDVVGEGQIGVTAAAHGDVGSSYNSFRDVAKFLLLLLEGGVPAEDQHVWRLWDIAASRVDRPTED